MLVMTYSDARKNLSSFLNQAKADGKALIKRSDGSEFEVIPVKNKAKKNSPFANVTGIDVGISLSDILQALNESREASAESIIDCLSFNKDNKIQSYFAKLKDVEL